MSGKKDDNPKPLIVHGPGLGLLWVIGWLYTIGFAHLGGWHILLGLVAWPYLLGKATS